MQSHARTAQTAPQIRGRPSPKDSSAIAGGVPDNRGHIAGAESIVEEGPAELSTGLPAEALRDALLARGIAANLSDDPGRYVCNNIFYRIMTESNARGLASGFVHLPYIHTVDAEDRVMLQSVVGEAVSAAVQKKRGGL